MSAIIVETPAKAPVSEFAPQEIVDLINQGIANFDGTPTTFVLNPQQYSALGDDVIFQISRETGLDCEPNMQAAKYEILIR